jgi:hypothetical protein
MKIIRAKNNNPIYQYSAYKVGWVFEVIDEYEDHYVAKVLSGSENLHDSVVAVHKNDCEELHVGSYESDNPYMAI